MKITTGEDHRPQDADAVAYSLRFWPTSAPMPADLSLNTSIVARAEINHGRWIVKCPWCPGATFAFENDPRFLCPYCMNKVEGMAQDPRADGRPIPVAWPEAFERAAIEAALVGRPRVKHMNWIVGIESVEDLLRENEANGVLAGGRVLPRTPSAKAAIGASGSPGKGDVPLDAPGASEGEV